MNLTPDQKRELLQKKGSPFMSIKFFDGYGSKNLLLPYKQGKALLDAIEGAERMEGYSDDFSIHPLVEKDVQISYISQEQYLQIKMAQLLDVKTSDLPLITLSERLSEFVKENTDDD